MLPQLGYLNTNTDYTQVIQPTKTYKLDINSGHIRGHTDQLAAMEQAVFKTLATERFQFYIYTPNYGVELEELVGARRAYIQGDIARRLREALTADDRIAGIRSVNITFDGEEADVSFIVETVYGDVIVERRIAIG